MRCRLQPAPRSHAQSACKGAGQYQRGSASLCHSKSAAQNLPRGASRCRPQCAARHRGSSVPRSLSSSASLCQPTSASRCPGRSVGMASELLVLSFHIGSFPPVSFHLGMAAFPTHFQESAGKLLLLVESPACKTVAKSIYFALLRNI